MCRSNDGFEIAEQDMAMRGPGDILGTRQSGYNKYIDELLTYPAIFRLAGKVAAVCRQEKLGAYLASLYQPPTA
jgi:ATP-dependent DNA helicase RecG